VNKNKDRLGYISEWKFSRRLDFSEWWR